MDPCSQVYVRRTGLVARQIAGGTIVVPVSAGVADMESIYTLNDVGSLIWESLDGQAAVGEIAAAVCERFAVSMETARADVAEFLAALSAAGLVRATQGS